MQEVMPCLDNKWTWELRSPRKYPVMISFFSDQWHCCAHSFFRYWLELMLTIYRWAFLNLIMKFHAYLGLSVICICRNISFPTSKRIQKLDIYLQTMYLGLPRIHLDQLKGKWYMYRICVESVFWRVYAVIQWTRWLIIDSNLHLYLYTL